MKEGLRSGNLPTEPEENGVLSKEENKESDMKQNSADLEDQVSLGNDTVTEAIKVNTEVEQISGSENRECTKKRSDRNEKKRIRINGEENEDDGGLKKKLKKDDKVLYVGRVLRSNSAAKSRGERERCEEVGKKNIDAESYSCENEVMVDKDVEEDGDSNDGEVRKKVKGRRGRPPKVRESGYSKIEGSKVKSKRGRPIKKVQVSDELSDRGRKRPKGKRGRPPKDKPNVQSISGGPNKIVDDSDESADEGRKRLKRKCGRPPKGKPNNEGRISDSPKKKAQDTNESGDEGSNSLEGKRGRPLKNKSDGVGRKKLRGKRGRPCKGEINNRILKGKFGKGKKVYLFRKKRKDSEKIKCETEDSEASPRLRSKKGQSGKKASETKDEMTGARAAKQLVRDQIVELLLGAGWTIEHRPRNGREYCDAVYVNPEGKTHWSVTLAYRVLKEHYDAGGSNSETSKPGFTFTPIPPDELKILAKVMHKTRSDKKKERSNSKKKNIDTEVVTKKKIKGKRPKGKLNRAASVGSKSRRRGIKAKRSLLEQDNCVGTSKSGTPMRSRISKQRGSQNRKRCALLVRKSVEGTDSDGGYVLYDGKRTVLSWMIELGTVPLDGKVQCMNQRKSCVMLEGQITRDGIRCNCCGEIISIPKFEAHAGSKLCNSYQNLYLESQTSLLQCIQDSWNKQDESERKGFHQVNVGQDDPNDDTCGICGDGGDLICCDGCPSTFHQSCLDIEISPSDKWHCIYCSCKFCRTGEKTRQMDSDYDSAVPVLLTCSLCEEKYHKCCAQVKDTESKDLIMPFCEEKCQEIFKRLQTLLGVKHELEGGYTWTLIHRSDGSDLFLNDAHKKAVCNAKLAVALSVMDECFLPLPDHRSGINLIHNIVYNFGSNFTRLNYSGFFTAILEKDDEIVSVASIRIHGSELAEMPFIGTRHIYRRQGMCRRILSGIESALCCLNVEKLVIPAISEMRETWTSVFGFKSLEASSKRRMRSMSLLVFPGVDMLQKPLLRNHFFAKITSPAEGSKSSELEKTTDEMIDNSDEKCMNGLDMKVYSEVSAPKLCKSNDESAVVASSFLLPDVSSHETGVKSEAVNFPESTTDTKCASVNGVSPDDLAQNEKSDTNPPGSMSNADEPTEEVSDCEGKNPDASRQAAENNASQVKLEDAASDETHVDLSAEVTAARQQNLDPFLGLKASSEDVVSHDLRATNQMSQDVEANKDLDSHEMENDSVSQNLPLGSRYVHHQDSNCSFHQTSENHAQGAQDFANSNSAKLSVDCNIDSLCQVNGVDAHKVTVSPTVNTDCHPSEEVSDAPKISDSQPALMNGSPDVSLDGHPELKKDSVCLNGGLVSDSFQPGSDSQVHHAGVKQCNSESLCNLSPGSGVALHCGSDGGQ